MRTLVAAAIALALASVAAFAQGYHYNQGYTTQNGTYVQPHYQTNPNSTQLDNWSTRGNTNPVTGQPGTHNPYGNTWGR
jgi:opacity protein-like surface antigen